MPIKQLDEATKLAIDGLSSEDTSRERSYAFEHELLFYGVEALIHYHIMNMARNISEGKISTDEFVKKYRLIFGDDPELEYTNVSPQFIGNLKLLTDDGIFVPQQAYNLPHVRSNGKVRFFDSDYRNRLSYDGWSNKQLAHTLIDHIWRPADLQNLELTRQGVEFARDLWQTCIWGFNFYKDGQGKTQPRHVTEPGEQLIEYYSSLILA